MTYATPQDMQNRYPARDLMQLAVAAPPNSQIMLGPWAASTAYSVGFLILDPNGNVQQCTTAGTSGTSAPTWPTIRGATVTDGSVVWTLNSTGLQQALNDASTEIDSYIESRFALPFTDPPAILNQVCTDIAWYRLQVSRPLRDSKDAKERYDGRVAWLKQVRDGDITLGMTVAGKEPTIATPTVLVQSPTTMPRSSLDRYTDLFNRKRLSSF
jgi:phage gp36-like protein